MLALRLAEAGRLPDWVIRAGIRRLLRARLEQSVPKDVAAQAEATRSFVRRMDASPVALATLSANRQHYEVPARFFELVMGRHLKYSCCWYEKGDEALDDAEAAMLALTCRRAEIDDGMRILELGCGWGSLSLWMAQHYPASRVTAVSNSRTQREFIEQRARSRGIGNLEVITADMNSFDIDRSFDRVVSVEMFEHMRNWRALMAGVARWLDSGGKFFMHVFCNRSVPYLFEDEGEDDWMSRHFFTGGIMPSADLALHFQQDMDVERVYKVNGRHYASTCEAWLANLDRRSGEALEVLAGGESPDAPRLQLHRWRLFFLACAELFAFRAGNEWFVAHYRFLRP
jgi:cyclopropane-fatty-acyl-phospholipid synthase